MQPIMSKEKDRNFRSAMMKITPVISFPLSSLSCIFFIVALLLKFIIQLHFSRGIEVLHQNFADDDAYVLATIAKILNYVMDLYQLDRR